jgi:hypothetical protein
MSCLNKGAVTLLLIVTGLFVWSFQAAAQHPDTQEAVKKFVQEFYDWYNAVSHSNNNKLSPDQRAIRERARIFDAGLIKALNEDYQESSKHPEEVVGLDWDPFLCSQDLDDRYEAGAVKSHGQNYFVEVYGIYKGKKNREPNVIAEVARNRGHLIFVNFRSPHGGDLLSDLKKLKESREKNRYQH